MPIPKRVIQASQAAKARVDKRKRKAEKARLEAIQAKVDPFIATLAETLESKGELRYEIPEGQWHNSGKKCTATGATADLQAACEKLGLKTKVEYYSDTKEYRLYEWAILVVKP